jgi:quercetin dioxygenase-like cupin family protein
MMNGLVAQTSMRDKVATLEAELSRLPQAYCPVRHYFAPGLYAREMSIPAGTVVTGAIHKTENLIVVSLGRLRIVTDKGTREVKAGDTFTCPAGMKNAVVALEDSRWTNFLANPSNETDTDKLAEIFTESKASELLGGADNKQLAANKAAERIEA